MGKVEVDERRYLFSHGSLDRTELDALKVNSGWGLKADRATWREHGDGHIARMIVLYHTLRSTLEKRGKIHLSKEQNAAIILSILTHDLMYAKDLESGYNQEAHQVKAADENWLSDIFTQLSQSAPDIFSDVSKENVVLLTSQINRVHDDANDGRALKTLQQEYDNTLQTLPIELILFREIDWSLERIRTKQRMEKVTPFPLRNVIFSLKPIRQSIFPVEHPHFPETCALSHLAKILLDKSRQAPDYSTNQWNAVMDTAGQLGLTIYKPL